METFLPNLKVLAAEATPSVEVGVTSSTLVVLLLSLLLITFGVYLILKRESSL